MPKKNWLLKQWEALPEKWRLELVSVSQTFIAAVMLQIAMDFPQDGETMNGDIVFGVMTAAFRSGVKAVFALVIGEVRKLVK